ncbi:SMI1/KNR4 family protein [Streptomyces sp. 15-116A]|uniref:SMI1/KNR4 family protein n=1 Tax=Streptomyces sp. 15-116A TaxID=2259035 RepID=UPI0021B192A4|nr:SMI1/KNR4 family protein [Streptomyces sp. 15-116A]MCT7352772.1 SMI1/KNR4 family protein [Streptomyces sp. 15-116A]
MTTDLVEDSWDRIDGWLRTHAPRTFAALASPATDDEIRAAEEKLRLRFHPELVASLRRHNGAQGWGAFRFPTHDRLLGVQGIVEATEFLRHVAADVYDDYGDYDAYEEWDEEDQEAAASYWHPAYLKFGDYESTADGLAIDCRAGDSYGAIGRFFDEGGTTFGRADSLGEYLADVADRLERSTSGDAPAAGECAVTFNGRLIWETAYPAHPGWGSADDPLPGDADVAGLPPLDLPACPPQPLRPGCLFGLEELATLVATLPRERIAVAAWRQMRRLAVETGLARYPEVTAALDAAQRGETVELRQDNALGLRLRSVIAQAGERRDNHRRWAAQTMVVAACGLPHHAVADIATARHHLSLTWRDDLLADLGAPPLPPSPPGDAFWAALRNPDIDTAHYAAGHAEWGDPV